MLRTAVIVLWLACAIASTSAQITCGDRLIFKRQCQAFVNSEPPLVTYAAQATKDLCQQQCEASINGGSTGRCCQYNKVRCKRAPPRPFMCARRPFRCSDWAFGMAVEAAWNHDKLRHLFSPRAKSLVIKPGCAWAVPPLVAAVIC